MNRPLLIVAGSLALGFIGFLLGSAVSQYQVRVLFYGPDQAGEFIDIFLVVWPLFFIVGGFFGNWLYKQNLTRRSSRRRR
jgi:hypothetical protein